MKKVNLFKSFILVFILSSILISCQDQENDIKSTTIEQITKRNDQTNITATYSDGLEVQMISNDNVNVELLCNDGAILTSIISDESISIFSAEGESLWTGDLDYIPSQVDGYYPGNCDLLGGIGEGESYSDCFARNWSNFCCDAVGCLSQASSPAFVALGIAIGCGLGVEDGGNRNLEHMVDNNTNQPLYN